MTSLQKQIVFDEPNKPQKNDIFYWTKKDINISAQILDKFAKDRDDEKNILEIIINKILLIFLKIKMPA